MPAALPADVATLLRTVWELFPARQHWPSFGAVDRRLHREHGLDIVEVIKRTPETLLLGGRGQGGAAASEDDQLMLTVAGVAALPGSGPTIAAFLRAIQIAVALEATSDGPEIALTSDLLRDQKVAPTRVLGLLLLRQPWAGGGVLQEGDEFTVRVTRRIRPYREAAEEGIDAYCERVEVDLALAEGRYTDELLGQLAMSGDGTMGDMTPPASPSNGLPVLLVPRQELEQQLGYRVTLGLKLENDLRGASRVEDIKALAAQYRTWDDYNATLIRSAFDDDGPENDYARAVWVLRGGSDPGVQQRELRQQIEERLERLHSLIGKLPLYREVSVTTAEAAVGALGTEIFIVHGHDGGAKETVARFLLRLTSREPTILHEQQEDWLTVIEKFEHHAAQAGAAVVLMTADDVGAAKNGGATPADLKDRARQNVILECGWFLGRLGRKNVIMLLEEGVEKPSDLEGLIYVAYTDGWRGKVASRLQTMGFQVDLKATL